MSWYIFATKNKLFLRFHPISPEGWRPNAVSREIDFKEGIAPTALLYIQLRSYY